MRVCAHIAILGALALGVGQSGCKSTWFPFSTAEHGVPLEEFKAADQKYFPRFVRKFFPNAERFQEEYPTIAQARADVKLIDVKSLNADPSKFNEANLSWSADGVYLGFEVITDGFRKIMLKDLVGNYARELQMIPKGRNTFLDGMVIRSAHSYNAGLRWSRDSTRFAFMSNGGIGEYNIYVGAVGASERTVAKSPTKDGYATWSPATNELAFVSGRTGRGDIYMVDLGDRNLVRLSQSDAVDIFPEWFPDGNRIVFSSGDALHHNLFLVSRLDNGGWGKAEPLTDWSHDDLRPTVSPDGRFIAFYSNSGEQLEGGLRRWNIVVVPYASGKTYMPGELRKMVVAEDVVIDLNTGPAWTPDSRKIFYVKRDPAVMNPIYGYDLFTGRSYMFRTNTRMNRDILMSKLGILSFRAQVGVWDKVFLALTNQGLQLQRPPQIESRIHYVKR